MQFQKRAINLIQRRWKGWLLALLLILAGYWGIARHGDWFLFQMHSTRSAREVSLVISRFRSSGLETRPLGMVTYGDVRWPVDVAFRKVANPKGTLCIFSGVHGNEPAGVDATLALAEDLAKRKELYPGIDLVIVPLVNPTGWIHDLRHNADNKDIARSFVSGGTQESALVKSLLATQRCDMLVDLHEDRIHAGVYLLAYGAEDAHTTAREVTRQVGLKGFSLNSSAPQGVYYVPPVQFPDVDLTTLSLYAQAHGVAQTFIAETPMRLSVSERIGVHWMVIDALALRILGV